MDRSSATARVVAMLQRIGQAHANQPLSRAVAQWIGEKREGGPRVHQFYARLISLVEEAVDEVAVAFDNPRLGDEARAQALEKATQPMRNVLDILVNNGVHSNAKVFVSDKVGELQLLELSVHKHLNVSSVSESELQEIRRAIGELKDTLRSAELPNPLRARLVRLLLSIEHALDEYELLGSEAALSALGSLIALSVGARAEIQQGATNGIWEQLSRLVNLMTVAKWGYQAGPVALSAAERFLLK